MQSIFRQFYYCIEITLLCLRYLSLNFNMALQYSEPDSFPGNEDMRVPIKLANSFIINFGFVGIIQHFSQFFYFF